MAQYRAGDILFDRYRIERPLGRGGFAEVYLAIHLHLKAPRALKVLLRGGGVTTRVLQQAAKRFRLEAQLGARFADVPYIVRVYDFERDARANLLVLVMEYLPGGSLKDHIRRAQTQGRKGLPVERVVRTAYHVALGLAALHREGLVHRDIKPSNILYDRKGLAKIADLGVVQMEHGVTRRSELGSIAPRHPGTPEYMSSEQESQVAYLRPASDIYSLGATLFRALTLQRYKHLPPGTRASRFRPDIPRWLDDLLLQMLSENPAERPWDGMTLARIVHDHVQGSRASKTAVVRPAAGAPSATDSWAKARTEQATRQTMPRGSRPRSQAETERPKPRPPHVAPASPRKPKRRVARLVVGGVLLLWVAVAVMVGGWFALGRTSKTDTASPAALQASPFAVTSAPTPSPTLTATREGTTTTTASPSRQQPRGDLMGDPAARIRLLTRWEQRGTTDVVWLEQGQRLRVLTTLGAYDIDPQTGAQGAFYALPPGLDVAAALSPDGASVLGATEDGDVVLWRISEGQIIPLRDVPARYSPWRAAFSADGRVVGMGQYCTDFDRNQRCLQAVRIGLWDAASGARLHTLDGHADDVWSLAFSPDGSVLASASWDETVRLWRVSDGELLHTLRGHADWVRGVAFSPDGDLLASSSCARRDPRKTWRCTQGEIRLWQVEDGAPLRIMEAHENWVMQVAFSPDGDLLASGSNDDTVQVWRVSDGAWLHTLDGHTNDIWEVAFSPDGAWLVSGGYDGVVRVWGPEGKR